MHLRIEPWPFHSSVKHITSTKSYPSGAIHKSKEEGQIPRVPSKKVKDCCPRFLLERKNLYSLLRLKKRKN